MKKVFVLFFVLLLSSVVKAQYTMSINRVHNNWHFIGGYGAGTMVSLLGKDPRQRIMLGAFSGAALGIAKEGYDLYKGGKPSVTDIALTTVGSIAGAMVVNWAFKRSGYKRKERQCKM